MTVHINSAILDGYETKTVTVEGDINRGLPRFEIIGLASKIIEESRSRIRSAIMNSRFAFPNHHLIINLAPAELYKTGPHLDLTIALAILALSKQILPKNLQDSMFLGELGLDGEIKPIRGILSLIDHAESQQIKRIFIPHQNSSEAQIIKTKAKIIPVKNLRELWQFLKNIVHISPLKHVVKITETETKSPIFDEIVGQFFAKRALVIAIAGHHNLLLHGPPGSGKSILAKSAQSLLPPLSTKDRIEITRMNSIISARNNLALARPFRTPHCSASRLAIFGGGAYLKPGEISLANHGVLFMDELPEFRRDILESLRQPLEDKQISLNYAGRSTSYPCDFLLLATANPCPCGNYGSSKKACSCTPSQRQIYRKKLSGPLLDRIDMSIIVDQPSTSVLVNSTTISTSEYETAKTNISTAISSQFQRQGKYNSSLSSYECAKLITRNDTRDILASCATKLKLSARSFFKLIRVARTIADIAKSAEILPEHCSEASQYRQSF